MERSKTSLRELEPDSAEYRHKSRYFRESLKGNERFWERLGGRPPLSGTRALDFGSGLGSLAIDLAEHGCAHVVGLDINPRDVAWSTDNLRRVYPHLDQVVEFTAAPIEELPQDNFDLIVSNQTFEHVMDLGSVLQAMRDRLRPGGRAYIAFGPLYRSPLGHHELTSIPWGHVVVPEPLLLRRINRARGTSATSIREFGLNMLRLSDYRRLIASSGLQVRSFRVNQNRNPLARLFSLGRLMPGLGEYFTHNVYCILERSK